MTTRSEAVRELMAKSLKRDLEVLVQRYNAVPDRANLRRVEAVRRELRELYS